MADDIKPKRRNSITLTDIIDLDPSIKYVVHKVAENPGVIPLEKNSSSQNPNSTLELIALLEGAMECPLNELKVGDIFYDKDKPQIHYKLDHEKNILIHSIHKDKKEIRSVDDFVDYKFDITDNNLRDGLNLAYIFNKHVFSQKNQDDLSIYELSTSSPASIIIDEQEYQIQLERTQNTCEVKLFEEPIQEQQTPVLPIPQVVEQTPQKQSFFQKIPSKLKIAALALGFAASGLAGYALKSPQVVEKQEILTPHIDSVANVPRNIEELRRAYTKLTEQAIESEFKNNRLETDNKKQSNQISTLKKLLKEKESESTKQEVTIITLEDDLNQSQINTITYRISLENTNEELDRILSLQKVAIDIQTCYGETISIPIIDGFVDAQSNIPILYNGECVNLDDVLLASDAIDKQNNNYLANLQKATLAIEQKSNQLQTQTTISDSLRDTILKNRDYITQLESKLKEIFHSHEFATSGSYRFNQIENLANEGKYHQINLLLTKYISLRCQLGENQCKNFDRLKVKVRSCEEGIYKIFEQMTFSQNVDERPDSERYNKVRDHFKNAVEGRCPSVFPKWMANPNKVARTISY